MTRIPKLPLFLVLSLLELLHGVALAREATEPWLERIAWMQADSRRSELLVVSREYSSDTPPPRFKLSIWGYDLSLRSVILCNAYTGFPNPSVQYLPRERVVALSFPPDWRVPESTTGFVNLVDLNTKQRRRLVMGHGAITADAARGLLFVPQDTGLLILQAATGRIVGRHDLRGDSGFGGVSVDRHGVLGALAGVDPYILRPPAYVPERFPSRLRDVGCLRESLPAVDPSLRRFFVRIGGPGCMPGPWNGYLHAIGPKPFERHKIAEDMVAPEVAWFVQRKNLLYIYDDSDCYGGCGSILRAYDTRTLEVLGEMAFDDYDQPPQLLGLDRDGSLLMLNARSSVEEKYDYETYLERRGARDLKLKQSVELSDQSFWHETYALDPAARRLWISPIRPEERPGILVVDLDTFDIVQP